MFVSKHALVIYIIIIVIAYSLLFLLISSYVRRDILETSMNEDLSEIALASTLLPADFKHLQQSNQDVEASVQTEFQSLLQLRDQLLQRQEETNRFQPIIQKDTEKDMFVPIGEYESWLRGSDLVEPVVMKLLEMKKKREEEEFVSSVNQEEPSIPATPTTPREESVVKMEEEHDQTGSNANTKDDCISNKIMNSTVEAEHTASAVIKKEEENPPPTSNNNNNNNSNSIGSSSNRTKRGEFDIHQVDSEYRDVETTELPQPPSSSLLDSILFVLQRSLKKEKQKSVPAGGEDEMTGEEKEEKENGNGNGNEDEMNSCTHGFLDPICMLHEMR